MFSKNEVIDLFNNNNLSVILSSYKKSELIEMYEALYECKPLSSFNKERIGQYIQQYINTLARTGALLSNLT